MSAFTARPEHGLAWVTGASSGIGRAVALKLAREGFAVVVTARSHDKLVALQREVTGPGRIIVLDGDVTDAGDMERVISAIEYEHGTLALVILNAGVYKPVHGEDLHLEDFQETFSVNLNGVVNCLLPAIRHMKAHRQGQIAIVSSVTGYGGLPTSGAYGATKAALINMAESLKFDLDKLGIRIQIVNPGFVDTPATKTNEFPMPALVSPDEAASAIVNGLHGSGFEITFPKRFTTVLKFINILPYWLYFPLVNAATGWKKRPSVTPRPKGNEGSETRQPV
jgi:NAD(P)-dependent dehydrogenase (short-subunit alcohol dehydrogenase family)